jgi:hypothetical protein
MLWRFFGVAVVVFVCSGNLASAQNSCANVSIIGTWDGSGLTEDDRGGIHAVGTFRIQDEADESKQPMFNLSFVNCHKKADSSGKEVLECEVLRSSVIAESGKPDASRPNCFLDFVSEDYEMKDLAPNVVSGMPRFRTEPCFDPVLTVNKETKRVYLSFIRSKRADKSEKIAPRMCGTKTPPTQVLMNCTMWPRMRKGGEASGRYCDFSTASDKIQMK